jgi:gas vesicle protein
MYDRDDYESSAGWSAFVSGALIGAGVALLLAPQTGSELRGMLRNYASRAKDDLVDRGRDAWDTAVERGKEYMETGREAVKDAGRTARDYMDTGREAIKTGMETGKEAIKSGKETIKDTAREATTHRS